MEQEIIERNKSLHVFMGFDIIPPRHYNEMNPALTYFGHMDKFGTVTELMSENDLKYHSDWSWIMPVVEKLEQGDIGVKMCRKRVEIYIDSTKDTIINVKEKDRLSSLHKAIYDFIMWDKESAGTTHK